MTRIVMHNSETGATRTVDAGAPFRWDEPAGCTSPRGWLWNDALNACVGNYLDYGADHYRSPHDYCRAGSLCRDCQPGNVHAVRYPDGPRSGRREWRYFETIAEAREWIQTGATAPREHLWQVVARGAAFAAFRDESEAVSFAAGVVIPGYPAEVVQVY
jgi:hypothetical protein